MIVARCLAWIVIGLAAQPALADEFSFFEAKIRPVLVEHCYRCHSAAAAGAGQLRAGLRVDSRAGLQQGGESGPALDLANPEESLLVQALLHDGLEMPPDQKLPPNVARDFVTWIRSGAPDPRAEGSTGLAANPPRRGLSIAEGRRFWSFVPPAAAPPPQVSSTDWPADDLDRFVLDRLTREGFVPLPAANPETLVRRLYFDLVGLPPDDNELVRQLTAETATAASASAAPLTAYQQLVDRLLASPHFGERWGRHWLDVARYADSNGRDRNMFFPHAWRYRDFVIDSFNCDRPFDQFLREQLAGDLLPAASDLERDRQRIATGFLALGAKAFEEAKPAVFQMDVVDEQIETISRAILGVSVGCARCHDHKFDPIPTADYYSLAGILRSTDLLYGQGPRGIKSNVFAHTELQAVGPDAERLAPAAKDYFARLQELTLVQNTARSDRYRVVRQLTAKKLELAQPRADQPALAQVLAQEIAELEARIKDWDATVKAAEQALQTALDDPPPQPQWAMAAREGNSPADCQIHIRGETTNLGAAVPRGVLQVVPLPAPQISPGESGRLQLAQWLTHPAHPLTARVFVNRVWQQLFGRGIVTTPDDFGVSGARPTHPELLDHLALRFQAEGYSVKRLIRAIVMSRTYRLASDAASAVRPPNQTPAEVAALFASQLQRDPDTNFLWRMRPRRLEAEILRDSLLVAAGGLDESRPADTPFAAYNTYREDEFRPFKPLFEPHELNAPLRSVYLPVVRGVLPPALALFDFAPPERSLALREESIVPAQALYVLNNPWVIDQSRRLARRILDTPAACGAERISLAYRWTLSRNATASELQRATAFLASGGEEERFELWISFCQSLFASAEFRYVR